MVDCYDNGKIVRGVLKSLGFVYRVTGIDLTFNIILYHYICKNFSKLYYRWKSIGNTPNLNFIDYMSIEMGSWQIEYGFYRRIR